MFKRNIKISHPKENSFQHQQWLFLPGVQDTNPPAFTLYLPEEREAQMAKAWEGPKMFKTQSSAARVLGGGHHDLAGGRMRPLLQTT